MQLVNKLNLNEACNPPSKRFLLAAGGLAATFAISTVLLKLYAKHKRNGRRKAYPANTVVLHQFPKPSDSPILSGPCLKLETWLRIAEIKYENEYSFFERSSQGQMPYITLNNQDFHDSQFIIEHLTKVYGKDLNDHLSQTEKSISRAILKLVEESLKWAMMYHRFTIAPTSEYMKMSYIFELIHRIFFKSAIKKVIIAQGYGKHTKEEVYHIGKQDLEALNTFLANKKFLFGDQPCTEDACLFAFIAQLVYYDKGPLNKFLQENCKNLVSHFNTIKNTYWTEWKQPQ